MIGLALTALAVTAGAPAGVTRFALSNGIEVISRQVEGSEVEGLAVFIIGGSRALSPDNQGIESFAIECALMGSGRYPGEAWRAMMDSTQATISGTYGYDASCCRLTCLSEDLPLLTDALADCLTDPEMDPEAVEQVRGGLVQGLLAEEYDPDSRVWLVANRGLFGPDHPYSLRPGGTSGTVPALDPDEAAAFLASRMESGNILICHAGPSSPERLAGILESSFGNLPRGGDEFLPVPAFPLTSDTLVFEAEDIPTAFAVVKFQGPPPDSPDYPVFRAGMDVVSELLWQRLRTDSALTYATYAGAGLSQGNWGYLYISSARPAEACPLLAEVYREASSGTLDEDLVRGTLESGRTAFSMQMASRGTQAYMMGIYEIETGDWRNAWLYSDIAAGCSPEEISAALARWSGPVSWGLIAGGGEAGLGPWPLGSGEDD